MKINITLAIIFLSFTLLAYSGLFEIPQTDRIGGTELNGNGCVCHSLEEDSTVIVWVEGPETLAVGQTGLYKMFLTGGPAEAGGYNVAGRFGTMSIVDTISVWDYRAPNELTQAFPLVFPTPQDTIFWPFEYTASDSSEVDTIYSCGLSIEYDSIPDFHDRWGFGPKFPLTITDVVPVELISFAAEVSNGNVNLNWKTASELNNRGFEVERKSQKSNVKSQTWEKIGYVSGFGTTTESKSYSFTDDLTLNHNLTHNLLYRLKQIDYDGSFQYSDEVEITIENLFTFELNQNYPNPFNPETAISWQLAVGGFVTLNVYDILGNEVAVLVNEEKPAGKFEINFDGSKLSSGLYFYRIAIHSDKLEAGKYSETRKMVLIK